MFGLNASLAKLPCISDFNKKIYFRDSIKLQCHHNFVKLTKKSKLAFNINCVSDLVLIKDI